MHTLHSLPRSCNNKCAQSVGFSEEDMDQVGVTKPGHRRKLMSRYRVGEFSTAPVENKDGSDVDKDIGDSGEDESGSGSDSESGSGSDDSDGDSESDDDSDSDDSEDESDSDSD